MTQVARGWMATTVPIVLWIAHLTATSALAELTCEHAEWRWLPHVLTVAGLALCVPFVAVLVGLTRLSNGSGQLRFIGHLGLLLALISSVLIAAEGVFAIFVEPCR